MTYELTEREAALMDAYRSLCPVFQGQASSFVIQFAKLQVAYTQRIEEERKALGMDTVTQ